MAVGSQEVVCLLLGQRPQEADKTCKGPCPTVCFQTVYQAPTKRTRTRPQAPAQTQSTRISWGGAGASGLHSGSLRHLQTQEPEEKMEARGQRAGLGPEHTRQRARGQSRPSLRRGWQWPRCGHRATVMGVRMSAKGWELKRDLARLFQRNGGACAGPRMKQN